MPSDNRDGGGGIRGAGYLNGSPLARAYPWLEVPVLGRDGELIHREGVTAAPGLFALGLRFQRTRGSHLLGGVGADAAAIAAAITARMHQAPESRAA